ncbi:DUF4442 domain-containing protein [Saccharobesus litoralis]|uniref:DUF4442 domain-containing protein n=1 Tax=Saccharobesus litoralis TaxID=2172099 RepID=UPI001E5A59A8|nr:DUF4442 domain-containing protein [Saccharobesus litoralis]
MPTLNQANWQLKAFAWRYVPLIAFHRPKILMLSDDAIALRIKLGWLTRNHLRSMYFGSLCVGADLAGGFLVYVMAQQQKLNLSFAFKAVQADFIKRPEADVVFTCQAGQQIAMALQQAISSQQRVNIPVNVSAQCPSISDDIVAKFSLTLSIKIKR